MGPFLICLGSAKLYLSGSIYLHFIIEEIYASFFLTEQLCQCNFALIYIMISADGCPWHYNISSLEIDGIR